MVNISMSRTPRDEWGELHVWNQQNGIQRQYHAYRPQSVLSTMCRCIKKKKQSFVPDTNKMKPRNKHSVSANNMTGAVSKHKTRKKKQSMYRSQKKDMNYVFTMTTFMQIPKYLDITYQSKQWRGLQGTDLWSVCTLLIKVCPLEKPDILYI